MKIGIDLSYEGIFDSSSKKEGIFRYNDFLFYELLRLDKTLELEFWCLEGNVPFFSDLHSKILRDFSERISFLTEKNTSGIFNGFFRIPFIKSLKQGSKLENLYGAIKNTSCADIGFSDVVSIYGLHYFPRKKIFTLHDLFTCLVPDLFRNAFSNIDKMNEEAIKNLSQFAREGAEFVVFNDYVKNNQLLKFVPDTENCCISVIPNPVMMRKNKMKDLGEEFVHKKYQFEGRYIFYPTINRPNKNILLILQALDILIKQGEIFRLVTTGSMGTLTQTDLYVRENCLSDYIIETGYLTDDEWYTLYKHSTVGVVTTIVEGPGMPQQVLEALQVGTLPVVCTKCLGVEESLKTVGLCLKDANLYWTDPYDPVGLAERIKFVCDHSEQVIFEQRGILDAYSKRTWSDVARDYLQLIYR